MKFRQHRWRHDPRSNRFSHHKYFGAVALSALPQTLGRVRGIVFDQGGTLRCTAYGSVANGYYIHGQKFSPDWQAFKIGKIQGRSVDDNGGDPNACMKAMRDCGFLPYTLSPFTLEKDGIDGSGYAAQWPNLDAEAQKYDLQAAFFKVDGKYDIFGNIMNALFLAYDPKTKSGACVDVFSGWYWEWEMGANPDKITRLPDGTFSTHASDGTKSDHIMPRAQSTPIGYHRFVFIDWIYLNGVPYLVVQNSYGTNWGDGGFALMSRDAVNYEFSQSGRTLKILKTITREQYEDAKQETTLGYIQRMILQCWYLLSEKYGDYVARLR